MTADKFHAGQIVIYRPWPGCPSEQYEMGIVTLVNSSFVFVRYLGDRSVKATRPDMLRLVAPSAELWAICEPADLGPATRARPT